MLYFTPDTIVPVDDSLQSDNKTYAAKMYSTGFYQYPRSAVQGLMTVLNFAFVN